MQDTEIHRALAAQAGRANFHPDFDGLRRRNIRRQRRKRLGVTLLGLALGAASIAMAAALVGPLASSDRPRPRPVDEPTIGIVPEGVLWIQTGSRVEVLPAGAEEPRPVASVSGYDVSPDGSLLLAKSGSDLVTVDVAGEIEVLTSPQQGDELQAFAEWSPDGTMVAYGVGSQDPANRSALCVLTPASGEQACFPDAAKLYTFDWAPDSSSIVVAGPPSQPVSRVDVATGEVSAVVAQQGDSPINRELEDRGWGRSMQLVGATWSPSGRFLAALANMEEGPYSYVPVVFTPDGSVVAFGRPSTEFPEPFAWSPVEDVLAYTQGEAPYRITEVYLLDPITGSERHPITSGGEEYPHVTDLVWSPSGRWLAMTLWWAEGGYLREAIRIVDTVDPDEVVEVEVDTGDITDPLVGWSR
jgi:WD40 repeat protein